MKSSVHSDYSRDEFAPGYIPVGSGINPCFPATMVVLTTGHLSCVCPLQLTLCNFSQDLGSNSFGRQRRGERGFRVHGLLLRAFVCDASSLSSAATEPPIHADWQANGSATVFKLRNPLDQCQRRRRSHTLVPTPPGLSSLFQGI